jgi:hypothetical protein
LTAPWFGDQFLEGCGMRDSGTGLNNQHLPE